MTIVTHFWYMRTTIPLRILPDIGPQFSTQPSDGSSTGSVGIEIGTKVLNDKYRTKLYALSTAVVLELELLGNVRREPLHSASWFATCWLLRRLLFINLLRTGRLSSCWRSGRCGYLPLIGPQVSVQPCPGSSTGALGSKFGTRCCESMTLPTLNSRGSRECLKSNLGGTSVGCQSFAVRGRLEGSKLSSLSAGSGLIFCRQSS